MSAVRLHDIESVINAQKEVIRVIALNAEVKAVAYQDVDLLDALHQLHFVLGSLEGAQMMQTAEKVGAA